MKRRPQPDCSQRVSTGDAFSDELKQETIAAIKDGPGTVDLVIYSLASGVRVDPADGTMYRSALKPIGQDYKSPRARHNDGTNHLNGDRARRG